MNPIRALLVLCLTLSSVGCAVFVDVGVEPRRGRNWDSGPIEHEDETIVVRNHLTWGPMSTRVLEPGRTRARAGFAWTNTNLVSTGGFLIDYESRTLELDANHGIAPGLEVGISVPILWRGGGVLDWALLQYHELTGLPLAQREQVKHGKFAVTGPRDDGGTYALTAQGTEIGDITLEARYLLTEGDDSAPAVTVIGRTRLPTASHDQYGADGIDLGAMIVTSKRWDRFTLYGGAGMTWYSDRTATGGFLYHEFGGIGFIAAEYRLLDWFSLQANLYVVTPMLDGTPDFDKRGVFTMTDVSGVFRLSETLDLEVLLRENIDPQSTTTDVTFFFGLVAHF